VNGTADAVSTSVAALSAPGAPHAAPALYVLQVDPVSLQSGRRSRSTLPAVGAVTSRTVTVSRQPVTVAARGTAERSKCTAARSLFA
jgi:hypothetical protein